MKSSIALFRGNCPCQLIISCIWNFFANASNACRSGPSPTISTIIFPPIAEEVFYRKAIIKFDTKGILIFTSSVGMILYALEHSLSWLGILETIIIAVPLTISYIKTKNVYIPMTAHFLVNLIGNGTTVILVAIKLLGL